MSPQQNHVTARRARSSAAASSGGRGVHRLTAAPSVRTATTGPGRPGRRRWPRPPTWAPARLGRARRPQRAQHALQEPGVSFEPEDEPDVRDALVRAEPDRADAPAAQGAGRSRRPAHGCRGVEVRRIGRARGDRRARDWEKRFERHGRLRRRRIAVKGTGRGSSAGTVASESPTPGRQHGGPAPSSGALLPAPGTVCRSPLAPKGHGTAVLGAVLRACRYALRSSSSRRSVSVIPSHTSVTRAAS